MSFVGVVWVYPVPELEEYVWSHSGSTEPAVSGHGTPGPKLLGRFETKLPSGVEGCFRGHTPLKNDSQHL